MALVQCHACGAGFEGTPRVCPECGEHDPADAPSSSFGCALTAGGLLFVGIILLLAGSYLWGVLATLTGLVGCVWAWAESQQSEAEVDTADLRSPDAAPVIDAPNERGYERWFRRSGDEPHVYRINQKPPKGLPKKLLSYVEVAGITREGRPEAVQAILDSSERRIELEREPDNLHDPNAVAVVAHWTRADKSDSQKIGYLPREAAAKLAEEFPDKEEIGATIEAVFAARGEKSPGIRIDVWGERDKRSKPKPKPYDPSIEVPADAVERNTKGRELEREGLVDNAIEFYRANVEEEFEGSFPYRRLAIIHRRRNEYEREVAILEEAV